MKKLHFTRKRNTFDEDLLAIISNELGTSLAKIFVIGKLLSLFPLNQHHSKINIAKEDVRKTLLILDPVVVERRKHKVVIRRVYELSSPMNTLHIDGIPISHCLSFLYI